eukprot:jgi/Mesen1/4455/ME000227S03470
MAGVAVTCKCSIHAVNHLLVPPSNSWKTAVSTRIAAIPSHSRVGASSESRSSSLVSSQLWGQQLSNARSNGSPPSISSSSSKIRSRPHVKATGEVEEAPKTTSSDRKEDINADPVVPSSNSKSSTGSGSDVIIEGESLGATLKKTRSSMGGTEQQKLSIDDVNPVGLGRRSRQLFDDVWRRLTQLGQLTQSPLEEEYEITQGPNCDFTTPNAEYTTVLVAGATGRVGRVLLRKLLLRGYTVRVVEGDLSDPAALQKAIVGCNKVIFCAGARSTMANDLNRVEHHGVANLAKAMLDNNHRLAQKRAGRSSKSKIVLAKMSKAEHQRGWDLKEGTTTRDQVELTYDGGMDSKLEFNEAGNGVFQGYVFTKGGYVELSRPISLPDGLTLDRYEGLVMGVLGDGKGYTLVLETRATDDAPARTYFARFNTRLSWSRVRLPFNSFRATTLDAPPLNPGLVETLAIRFEPRRTRVSPPVRSSRGAPMSEVETGKDPNSFRIEIDFIKALPGGEETDFILLSCTGAGVEENTREKVLKAKLAGEAALKNSGLGYTIEEPGGQRALVFDQGNRITQAISCADVADVCVKALHDPTARNKSFDVCHEYTAEEGTGLYELVAHLPDKSNNYLTPALALLEKNT